MQELILSLFFTWIISTFSFPILARLKSFQEKDYLSKTIAVLATSIGSFILLSSWGAILFKDNIHSYLSFLISICILLSIYSIPKFIQILKKFLSSKTFSDNKSLILIISLLLLKIFTLFYIKPVTDSDVINAYLPYARSMVEANQVLDVDSYTFNPMMVPPVGGPMIYASSYVLSGSTETEIFKLMSFPFIMGIVLLIYKMSSSHFSKKISLLASIMFLTLPVIDNLILEWSIYPDTIFTFLITYVFFQIIDKKNKWNIHDSVFIGLALAASVLLKNQGVMIIYLVLLLIIQKYISSFSKKALKIIFNLLLFFPIIIRLIKLPGIPSFGVPYVETHSYIAIAIVLILTLAITTRKKAPYTYTKYSLKHYAYILLISLFGFVWIYRNITAHQGIVSPGSLLSKEKISQILAFSHINSKAILEFSKSIGTINNISPKISSWYAIFILPVFGTFLFLPKIVGIVASLKNNKLHNFLFFIVYWYVLNILYFGYPNTRYIFVILPMLTILIIYGLKVIFSKLFRSKKVYSSISIFVLLFSLVSLSQSIYLTWLGGVSIISKNELKTIAFSEYQDTASSKTSSLEKISNLQIKDVAIQTIKRLNIKNSLMSSSDIQTLIIYGIGISLFLTLLSSKGAKNISLNKLSKATSILLIAPYILVIYLISDGSLSMYSRKLEEKIFDYWGQSTYVIPKLTQDNYIGTILKIGPSTGLAYKTQSPVINIWRGYSVNKFPSLVSSNIEKVYDELEKESIRYIVYIDSDKEDTISNTFRKDSSLKEVILSEDKYESIINPDNQNKWVVLERIDDSRESK